MDTDLYNVLCLVLTSKNSVIEPSLCNWHQSLDLNFMHYVCPPQRSWIKKKKKKAKNRDLVCGNVTNIPVAMFYRVSVGWFE